jgi:hypothetical protein
MQVDDWTKARFEAIATLAMNGILANPATGGLPAADVAKKAVENAKALDAALTNTATPVTTTQQQKT